MSEKEKANLLAVIDAIEKIQSFASSTLDVDAFYEDQKTFDAVLMNFVIIGESISRLPESFTKNHSSIPWKQIKGFRNIVAHDYFGVDAEEVWQILQHDLPVLKYQISQITNN